MHVKAELKEREVNRYINLLSSLKIPFKLSLSNYTAKITSDIYNIDFLKQKQSLSVFAAFSKLKSELFKPVETIDTKYLKYYNTGFNFNDFYADTIYNVDIRSAYVTILYNDGIISEDTYNMICRLPKQERLAVVGMLASRKNIFEFDNNGKIVQHEEKISPHANYFFYCVKRTYDIMNEAKEIAGSHYLFSWVDSIYFTGGKFIADLIQESLKDTFNVNTSYTELNEFNINRHNDHFKIKYKKEGKGKYMSVPAPSNLASNIISQIKTKQNENFTL